MRPSDKKAKVRIADRIYFFGDQIAKSSITFLDEVKLIIRGPMNADRRLLNSIMSFFSLLLSAPGERRSIAVSVIKLLFGLPFIIIVGTIILTLTLIAGSLASVFGLRNTADYSFKEKLTAWAPLVIVLILPPFFGDYYAFKVSNILCFAILMIGMDFLFGHCGIMSLGHAGFVMIGAYVTTWLFAGTFSPAIPFVVSVIVAGLVCATLGLLLGLPAIRIKDHYLAVVTLSFGVTIPKILKSKYLADYTGVIKGGLPIEQPKIPDFLSKLSPEAFNYYIRLLFFLALLYFAYSLIRHSQVGRAFKTIKCDSEVSSILGVPVVKYKTIAFTISAFYAGVAGGLIMLSSKFISVESYNVQDSIQYNIASVLGGTGSFLGAFFAGTYLSFEADISVWASRLLPRGESLMIAISGALLILVSYFGPTGLAGGLSKLVKAKFSSGVRRGQHYVSPPPDYDYLESKGLPFQSKHLTRKPKYD